MAWRFFTGILIWALLQGLGTFGVLSLFLLLANLAAISIDSVRLHTKWHPLVKLVAYPLIFILAFVLMMIAFVLMQIFGVIK